MKNFFLIPAVFVLALIIGCQDNIVNEPTEVLLKGEKPADISSPATTSNTIKLNHELKDPAFGSSKLTGRVTFEHKLITGSMSPVGLKRVALHIYINSVLDDMFGMSHMEWRVEDRSDDGFYLSEEGIYLLEKSYRITNRYDVVLLVQYLVTTDGVGISRVSLAEIEK